MMRWRLRIPCLNSGGLRHRCCGSLAVYGAGVDVQYHCNLFGHDGRQDD